MVDNSLSQMQISGYKARQIAIFRTLVWRNRLIGILRLAVPGVGILFTGFLSIQIIWSGIASDYGISSLTVEKDQVVIEKPRYGGVMQNGTLYQIVADLARININARNKIDLVDANIQIEETGGYKILADASSAQLDLTRQNVVIPGLLKTLDTDNVAGLLNDVIIDWPMQVLTSRGDVRFEFDDGSTIEAQSLVYNGAIGEWDFSRVIYKVPGDGGI